MIFRVVVVVLACLLWFCESKELRLVQQDRFSNEHDLLDIVLVASVDGKFHALSRSSGHTLWSMSSFPTTTSVSAPSSLSPLIRTLHQQDDDLEDRETYIIEPQSGDIYVLHDPSSPLQRFPFSMQELVDISPFTSTNGEQTRVFVGRKETSLLLIELETGKIKATLNSECPPIDWEQDQMKQLDTDEFEEDEHQMSAPTAVYIGRTDYHISIHKKPLPGQPTPLPQNLSFSVYGPNNRDNHRQALYRRTKDDTYIQSLPNGEVISFLTKSDTDGGVTQPLWGHQFRTPIVAIFDVLRPSSSSSSSSSSPFVLLQPRPRLQDLFPNLFANNKNPFPSSIFPNFGSAYVGLVEETGSLFAMSPERYPLVLFGGSADDRDKDLTGMDSRASSNGMTGTVGDHKKTLDPPPPRRGYRPDGDAEDEPFTFGKGATTGEDNSNSLLDKCLINPRDLRCLVGVRPLDDDDGYNGRLKRLLEGPKSSSPQPVQHPMMGGEEEGSVIDRYHQEEGSNSSGGMLGLPDAGALVGMTSNWRPPWFKIGLLDSAEVGNSLVEAVVLAVILGLVSLWFLWEKIWRWKGFWQVEDRKTVDEIKEVVDEVLQMRKRGEDEGQSQTLSGPSLPSSNGTMGDDEKVLVPNGNENNGVLKVDTTPTSTVFPEKKTKKELAGSLSDQQPAEEETKEPPGPSISSSALADTITTTTPGGEDRDGGGEDSEGEGEGPGTAAAAAGVKKRVRRGKRGKKKKPGLVPLIGEGEQEKKEDGAGGDEKPSLVFMNHASPKTTPTAVQQQQQSSLVVSDTILGFGSHGTVVFQGSFQGRSVAVKRLLRDFVTLADREVSILQESDDHPNVIRYYYQEAHDNFLYIALELCPASLADVIENPNGGRDELWREIAVGFDPKRALRQVTSGLRHLHGLKLVHRDIKPQNILVSVVKKGSARDGGNGGVSYRMLISDFGLCKRLDVDQTSFLPTVHGAHAAGTVGWRAPEILRGEVKLDERLMLTGDGSSSSSSSRGSSSSSSAGTVLGDHGGNSNRPQTRLTKSVDIFSLGCLFYYTLTNGGHPYGDRFEREVNIMKDAKDVSGVERFGEEGTEAKDLILKMLSFDPSQRPDTTTTLLHPYFWDASRRLNFLQDASDRFEIMCRDPKDPDLISLENGSLGVVGQDWHVRLDKVFIENLGKYRKYDGRSVQDLLRALRNKKHHYQDLPENVKRHLGPMPEGFLAYFTKRYPQLFLHVHTVIKETTGLHTESMFRTYFELPQDS